MQSCPLFIYEGITPVQNLRVPGFVDSLTPYRHTSHLNEISYWKRAEPLWSLSLFTSCLRPACMPNNTPTNLIYCTRDEALNIFLSSEYMRERAAKWWNSLDSWERYLPYTRTVIKAKYSLRLIEGNTFRHSAHIPVKLRHRAANKKKTGYLVTYTQSHGQNIYIYVCATNALTTLWLSEMIIHKKAV